MAVLYTNTTNSQGLIDLNWDKVFEEKIEPLQFVFGGLMSGTVGALIAPGGAGKSFLALSIATSLTTKNIIGLDVEPADNHVCYITAEDPMTILEHRALALVRNLNLQERERIKRLVTLQSIHGHIPTLIDSNGVPDWRWIEGLKRAATGKSLLIIDTLRKFHQGEENDSGHMTILTQVLDHIASETGCAVLFLHHANKLTTLAGQGSSQAASRGSSALVDNIRYQLNLTGMTEAEAEQLGVEESCRSGFLKMVSSKANYAPEGKDHWLRRLTGGVLAEAQLESPAAVKRAKERKAAFDQKAQEEKRQVSINPSSAKSIKAAGELSHQDIFG